MTEGEYAPHLRAQAERVWERLKHNLAVVRRAISCTSERRETERMGGVVCEVEATLQCDRCRSGVAEANASRVEQSLVLRSIRSFRMKRTASDQIIER